jgi:hypothetical protein
VQVRQALTLVEEHVAQFGMLQIEQEPPIKKKGEAQVAQLLSALQV